MGCTYSYVAGARLDGSTVPHIQRRLRMETSDNQIKTAVVEELETDWRIDDSNISVEVNHGTVDLKGKVPNARSKLAAYYDALSVKQVTNVNNHIHVCIPGC
jgi:osmotically-inducible protein OsmY